MTSTRNNVYPTPKATPDRTIVQPPSESATQDIAHTPSQDSETSDPIPGANTSQEPSQESIHEAPRASEVSADLSEQNILPKGTRRKRNTKKEAYFTALDNVRDLTSYYGAFTAALVESKRPHRDTLPLEPRT